MNNILIIMERSMKKWFCWFWKKVEVLNVNLGVNQNATFWNVRSFLQELGMISDYQFFFVLVQDVCHVNECLEAGNAVPFSGRLASYPPLSQGMPSEFRPIYPWNSTHFSSVWQWCHLGLCNIWKRNTITERYQIKTTMCNSFRAKKTTNRYWYCKNHTIRFTKSSHWL